jgi:hypothetical protein
VSIFSVITVQFVTLHPTFGFSATSVGKKTLNKPSADLIALCDVISNGRKISRRRQHEKEEKQLNK